MGELRLTDEDYRAILKAVDGELQQEELFADKKEFHPWMNGKCLVLEQN